MKQQLDLGWLAFTLPEPKRPRPPRAIRLGIQLGGIYKLKTPHGYLIVQVLEFQHRKVTVKEVEDNRRFRVNPAHLSEY